MKTEHGMWKLMMLAGGVTFVLGMGGAFVAVADDGSAIYWNPAGLATGPYFELRFEHQSEGLQTPSSIRGCDFR